MNVKRLLHLISILKRLEEIEEFYFSINHWFKAEGIKDAMVIPDDFGKSTNIFQEIKSGTCPIVFSACAGGWAALDPELEFQKEGLHLIIQVDFSLYNYGTAYGCLKYGEEFDILALVGFFDLSYQDATWIFNPYSYPFQVPVTPPVIIQQINHLLERGIS